MCHAIRGIVFPFGFIQLESLGRSVIATLIDIHINVSFVLSSYEHFQQHLFNILE